MSSVKDNSEMWENRELGASEEHVKVYEGDIEISNTQSKVFYNMQALLDYVLIFKLKHFAVRTKMGGVVLTYQKENHQ